MTDILTDTTVVKRIEEEFCVEAKIKMMKHTEMAVENRDASGDLRRSEFHPTKTFFHDSNITYGSWSLSALIRDGLVDAGYKPQPKVISCISLLRVVVIPGYTARYIKKLKKPDAIK